MTGVLAHKKINVQPTPFHELPEAHWKQLWFNDTDQCRTETAGCITTAITLKAGDQGRIHVSDTAQPNWEFSCDSIELTLRDHNARRTSDATDRIINKKCSPKKLEFDIDTKGLPAHHSYRMTIEATALAAGGVGKVKYYNEAEITAAGKRTLVKTSNESSYIGGYADGASITLRKADVIGNDANTQNTAVALPDENIGLVYTIVNNGDQKLRDVRLVDEVRAGKASVKNLTCEFPDGSNGTVWAGPFAPQDSFECTAQLTGVFGSHHNVATVTAIGEGSEPVTANDPYYANNTRAVKVGNLVWQDLNGDGRYDKDEPGLRGVTLTISRSDNAAVTSNLGEPYETATQTNESGHYEFTGLAALPTGVKYVVTVGDVPAGLEPTKSDVGGLENVDNNSSTGSATSVGLTVDGAQDLSLDFGFVNKSKVSVGDLVWLDANRDGQYQEGQENGIDGVTLTISRTDGAPVTDYAGSGYTVTQQTSNGGKYRFADLAVLPEGVKYVVTVSNVPAEYEPTVADVGGLESVDNNSSTGKAVSKALVANGAEDLTLDFGFVKKKVSAGDYVWWDVNRDGQQNEGEKPVSKVTVKLFNETGEQIGSTETNDNGFYSFIDLNAGEKYSVQFVAPKNVSFTAQQEGDEMTDSNPGVDGVAQFTAPLTGQNKTEKPDLPSIDAGLVQLNLVLVKTLETTGTVYPGDEVVFSLTPANEGPVDALAGWSVTDVLPAGLTLTEITGEGYTCDQTTASCVAVSGLTAGSTGNKITVKAKVAADAKGSLHNVAYVEPAAGETVETNPLNQKPVTGTNTDETVTDNDSQAVVKVSEMIVPEKPGLVKTGGQLPLYGAGVAVLLLLTGAMVFSRRRQRA